jgi:hypothetical protein
LMDAILYLTKIKMKWNSRKQKGNTTLER